MSRDRGTESSGYAEVFRAPAPHQPDTPRSLEAVTRFAVPAEVKAGDFSPDGSAILLRPHAFGYRADALLWRWDRKTRLPALFASKPEKLPAAQEIQGEAITFSADGTSYFTVSEGAGVPIYRYPLPNSPEK